MGAAATTICCLKLVVEQSEISEVLVFDCGQLLPSEIASIDEMVAGLYAHTTGVSAHDQSK